MTHRLSILALTLCALTGCSGVGRFEIDRDIPEQMVAGSPVGGLLGPVAIPIPISIDLSAETAAHHTGPVQHVRLEALSFDVTATDMPAGDQDDLAFIDSIDIFVESTASGSALPRQRVAHGEGVPAGTTHMALTTDTTVDLKPYVDEGARLTASAQGHAPMDDVSFDGQYAVSVEVL